MRPDLTVGLDAGPRRYPDQPLRVLAVDDDDDCRSLLRAALSRDMWVVRTAVDGLDGLIDARRFRPDVVVLDWLLPTMSGAEVCRELTRARSPGRPRVVMVTSRTAESDVELAYAAGADAFLTKPFVREELVRTVRALVEARQEARCAGLTRCVDCGSPLGPPSGRTPPR